MVPLFGKPVRFDLYKQFFITMIHKFEIAYTNGLLLTLLKLKVGVNYLIFYASPDMPLMSWEPFLKFILRTNNNTWAPPCICHHL